MACQMKCPATMCPLIAPNGSPWNGSYGALCPGHDDIDSDGCPWWSMGCGGNGMVVMVDEAEADGGRVVVVGPNQPKRSGFSTPREFDCPEAHHCRWQEQSPTGLCAPREALKRGMDPRVCLF